MLFALIYADIQWIKSWCILPSAVGKKSHQGTKAAFTNWFVSLQTWSILLWWVNSNTQSKTPNSDTIYQPRRSFAPQSFTYSSQVPDFINKAEVCLPPGKRLLWSWLLSNGNQYWNSFLASAKCFLLCKLLLQPQFWYSWISQHISLIYQLFKKPVSISLESYLQFLNILCCWTYYSGITFLFFMEECALIDIKIKAENLLKGGRKWLDVWCIAKLQTEPCSWQGVDFQAVPDPAPDFLSQS